MTTKLGFTWATDANHSEGGTDWDGQPSKVAPSAARQATGMLPTDLFAPEWFNYMLNNIVTVVNNIGTVHVFNFSDADFTEVSTGVANWTGSSLGNADPGNGDYNTISSYFTAINTRGNTVYSVDTKDPNSADVATDGSKWNDEATDPRSLGGYSATSKAAKIACNPANGMRVVAPGDGAETGSTYYSLGINNWQSVATSTDAHWYSVDFNTSTRCCLGGSDGYINYSNTGSSGWTAATVTASTDFLVLKHNRQTGSAGWWVAMASTEYARSDDGITWASGLHGLGAPVYALDYSALNNRWGCVTSDGFFGYSDDEGASWTKLGSALDNFPTACLQSSLGLATDGSDNWLITYEKDGANTKIWASTDNGATWEQIYTPTAAGCAGAGPVWGANRFVIIGRTSASYGLRIA